MRTRVDAVGVLHAHGSSGGFHCVDAASTSAVEAEIWSVPWFVSLLPLHFCAFLMGKRKQVRMSLPIQGESALH